MLEISIRKKLGAFDLTIDLVAPANQIIVLFGSSGAGKSLTLATIAGFLQPDAGRIVTRQRVLFDSEHGIDLLPQYRRIGLVKQDLALFPHLTVTQNIAYGLFRESQQTQRECVNNFLRLMNLAEFAARYPAQLSGGQQQRVALARALAPQPELLLLDEPFSALDAPTRVQLRNELLQLQRQLEIPIVFVTHDLGEAYFLADQLAVIDAGKVCQVAAPGEILQHPNSLPVARAVGMKNILPGTVLECGEMFCHVQIGDQVIETALSAFDPGTPVTVCIRPERIMLVRPGKASAFPDQNSLHGEIVRELNDGMMATLFFRAHTQRLLPDQDHDLQIELPVYIYERLDLARQRAWTVSLRKNAIHLIPRRV